MVTFQNFCFCQLTNSKGLIFIFLTIHKSLLKLKDRASKSNKQQQFGLSTSRIAVADYWHEEMN